MLNRFKFSDAARRKAMRIGVGIGAAIVIFLLLTLMQARHFSTTQVAMFLNDEAQIVAQFKAQGLRPDELVLNRNAQDVSYVVSLSDTWGTLSLQGSVSIFTSSGGTQMLWTLTHDAGYHLLRRWTGRAWMDAQGTALQTRLQAFKVLVNTAPSTAQSAAVAVPVPAVPVGAKKP